VILLRELVNVNTRKVVTLSLESSVFVMTFTGYGLGAAGLY